MQNSIVLIAFALLLYACGEQQPTSTTNELTGYTMGTSFSVKVIAVGDLPSKEILQKQVTEALARINERLSTWLPDSELSLFNANTSTDPVIVSAEFCAVIEAALELSEQTNGAFDVTVGPLVNLWGFGPDRRNSDSPPSEVLIAAARQRIGYTKLVTDCQVPSIRKLQPNLYIDLSGYAKGYAVDQIAELLNRHTLKNYLIEVGGELRMRGHNGGGDSWSVAVEMPDDNDRRVQTVVRLTNQSMATSGDYRNFFESNGQRYSHTIDSRTGRPVSHNGAAVTVVANTAAEADALATALLVLGPDDGLEFAERNNIAAYFLIRRGVEIVEKSSTVFSMLPRQ